MRMTRVPLLAAGAVLMLAAGCVDVDDPSEAEGATDPDASAGVDAELPGDEATDGDDRAEPVGGDVDGTLEVAFLDVGQGDATLLTHDEVTVLVDAGRHNRTDVLEHLADRGIGEIDVLLLTHPHADHIGQADRIVTDLEVGEVWASPATHTTLTYERLLDAIEDTGVVYEEPAAGQATDLGPLQVDVVGPDEHADLRNLHDAGLSVRVSFGEHAWLFTGDAEAATEARYVEHHRELLDVDVYQAGHHGSSTSSTEALLEATGPDIAVYSAGAGNSYGHPHAEVLDRLDGRGIDVYGTDVHGTVNTSSTGSGQIEVSTDRDGDPAPGGDGGAPSHDNGPEHDEAAEDCVDLNEASADELERIVHIGTERAAQIVEGRPWETVGQLDRIDGIGPARLDDIRSEALACVG